MPNERVMTYSEAIKSAFDDALTKWPEMILIGEGVTDPKGIFDTTTGLQEKFGADRVYDMPLAENGMTGVCIGLAIDGMRPVMIHQRIDFSLLAMDQIINNAAKWHYMFNGQQQVPLVIRMIIGKGWGQGPQHSQGLQSLFASIPGLKVVMPVTSHDAYHMMMTAIEDNNPVLFIEHRWLHHVTGPVDKQQNVSLVGAQILKEGTDVTIVAFSQMVIESLKVAETLQQEGIEAEVIDMRSVSHLDIDCVVTSLQKTGRLVIIDCACDVASVGHTIISKLSQTNPGLFRLPPLLMAWPNHPVPTSSFQAKHYYPEYNEILASILNMFGKATPATIELPANKMDIPNREFVGPF
jgi:pyruvate dehydrogenase E1 component beta subunit